MRKLRLFFLNLFLPPALAASLIAVGIGGYEWLEKGHPPQIIWGPSLVSGIAIWVFYAYVLGGLPSLLHAFAMNWTYRSTAPHSRRSILTSTLSGALAGGLISLFFVAAGSRGTEGLAMIGFFLLWGAVTGTLTGLVVAAVAGKPSQPHTSTP